jgi:ABC-type transport system substrate-binding protein
VAGRRLAVAFVAMSVVVAGACDRGASTPRRPAPSTTSVGERSGDGAGSGSDQAVEVTVPDRPRGGSARVGVWAAPDPTAPTLGGAAVRALVLPQLFVARPDGRWSPALVEPRTDVTGGGSMSAAFRLRRGASWSDGSPITVEDLRRSADERFVSAVEAGEDGLITLRFASPLPGWRRLWSGADSISPPADGVWGGPFVVASTVAGLETVLRRNDAWWGNGPFLDEVRLVLVPDPTTARQLLARAELDAVMPPAATARTRQLEAIPEVEVERVERGGWSVAVLANPDTLAEDRRRALFATLDRAAFVSTLLAGEATLLQGFAPSGEDATWVDVRPGDTDALAGETVDLVGFAEEPMTWLVHRAMQKRVRADTDGKATIELRSAEADRVEGWVARGEYEAAIVPSLDPLGGCWTCRWPDQGDTARAADAGDPVAVAALQAQLRDSARVLPLWRPTTVVAWRRGLEGVRANGYAASAAWNAWEWWRP